MVLSKMTNHKPALSKGIRKSLYEQHSTKGNQSQTCTQQSDQNTCINSTHRTRERETPISKIQVVSPISEGGQIHLNPAAILFTLTLHFERHLSSSNQPSYFLPQPIFSMSSMASPSSFDYQPQNLMPFLKHDHSLSTTHDHSNKHCLP